MFLLDLMLNLFVDQQILISHIISPDFDLAFNVDSNHSKALERIKIIRDFLYTGLTI